MAACAVLAHPDVESSKETWTWKVFRKRVHLDVRGRHRRAVAHGAVALGECVAAVDMRKGRRRRLQRHAA